MVFDRFGGCILRGPEADLPSHASYWSGYKYECTNNGNIYSNNGSAWVLIQGATKSETLKNKLINFDQNTVSGVMRDPFSLNKRIGYLIPAPTIAASLQLALKGLPGVGSYSLVYDATEGWVCRFSTSIVEQIGFFSNALPTFVTRRSQLPKIKVRMKSSVTLSVNAIIGFTDNASGFQSANNPQVNDTNTVWFGIGSAYSANFVGARTTNGSGAGISTTTTTPRDTAWHTLELQLNANDITYILDNNTPLVSSNSALPDINADLKLYLQMSSRDTTPKTFDIARVYFESNIT